MELQRMRSPQARVALAALTALAPLGALGILALGATPGEAAASDAVVVPLMARDLIGTPGTFYEGPDDVHVVSENLSRTKPARFLVAMVKDKATATAGESDQSGQGRAQAAGRTLLGLPGPDLVLHTIDGKTIDLSKLYGRPRALMFFSPWCESYLAKSRPAVSQACRRVREEVNELAPHGRVRWIGIASGLWASAKDLTDYQKDPGTTTVVLLDAQGRIAAKLGPEDRGLGEALRALESTRRLAVDVQPRAAR